LSTIAAGFEPRREEGKREESTMAAYETFYDVIRRQGITRRSFTKF